MPADDDSDCPEHHWVLDELIINGTGAEMASTCSRCGAVLFEPSARDEPNRPKL